MRKQIVLLGGACILFAVVVLLITEIRNIPTTTTTKIECMPTTEQTKIEKELSQLSSAIESFLSSSTGTKNVDGQQPQSCPECPQPQCPVCPPASPASDVFSAAQSLWKYENPIMNKDRAQKVASRYAKLPAKAINFRDEEQKTLFKEKLRPFLEEKQTKFPWRDNAMYGPIDEFFLYSFARWAKPKRVIEIGSGFSTVAMNKALMMNAQDGYPGEHICIEPYRADEIKVDGNITIIVKPLEEVGLELFSSLESGDMLFVDSSHVVVPYSDVIMEYAFILPVLPKGVIVHIHDIFLPFDYPPRWMFEESPFRTYDEQWLVAVLLAGGDNWKVLWATYYMQQTYPELFAELPHAPFFSNNFWMVRN